MIPPVEPGMQTVEDFSTWFTKLECAGLRPYYFEVNMLDVNNRRADPSIAYVSVWLREFRLDLNGVFFSFFFFFFFFSVVVY
jgi:hypothetical protein